MVPTNCNLRMGEVGMKEWPVVIGNRFPGGVMIGALAVFATGAAIGFLAPSLSDAPPFVTDDVDQVAAAIAGNPSAWQWATLSCQLLPSEDCNWSEPSFRPWSRSDGFERLGWGYL